MAENEKVEHDLEHRPIDDFDEYGDVRFEPAPRDSRVRVYRKDGGISGSMQFGHHVLRNLVTAAAVLMEVAQDHPTLAGLYDRDIEIGVAWLKQVWPDNGEEANPGRR